MDEKSDIHRVVSGLTENIDHAVELKGKCNVREYKWTDSVAVGSIDFVEKTKEKLGIKIKGRKITENNGVYELKESNTTAYGNDYSNKIDAIRSENAYFWESFPL